MCCTRPKTVIPKKLNKTLGLQRKPDGESVRLSAYPLDHLYPGSIGQDLFFQSFLTAPGRLQPVLTDHRAHLCGQAHILLQPRQGLWGRREEEGVGDDIRGIGLEEVTDDK